MAVIGITGGIATGKSTFCECLRTRKPAAIFFNADTAARELTDQDAETKAALRRDFGDEIFSEAGDLNRGALRAIVFADAERKAALEQILHPRIRQRWSLQADEARKQGDLFLADIPLLYETGGETICDRVIVVACGPAQQRDRLMARSRLTSVEAEQMIAAQMPLEEKVKRAAHVIWNNGPRAVLEAQAELMARILT